MNTHGLFSQGTDYGIYLCHAILAVHKCIDPQSDTQIYFSPSSAFKYLMMSLKI